MDAIGDAQGDRGLPFVKGHGTGNDFVVLPDADGLLDLTPALIRRLCDRRFGIGGDGVLRVVRSKHVPEAPGADADARLTEWFMDYHNADGSIAEMCGNGVRVYARFLVASGWAQPGELVLATRGGHKTVEVGADGDVRVDMGPPEVLGSASARFGDREVVGCAVSMGNPHLATRVADVEELRRLDLTAPVVGDPDVFPTGVNLEFVVEAADSALEMRVHERGVGETLSCGTGACAVAVAAMGAPGPAREVRVPGGRLLVEWTEHSVFLSGPAELVAEGHWCG
ncbi:MAG: diaminopimelate epimerase [Frankiaceae bacterium]|nr:diaminopimelate epimerase [Frankiaceae bacterium]